MPTAHRLTLLALLALGACNAERPGSPPANETMTVEAGASAAASGGARAPAASADTAGVAAPQIAYTYDFELELPARAVTPLFERHRSACEAAGSARCQVIGAETMTVGRTDTRATLTLRAEPAWLAAFRARLAADAAGADGRVAASKTASEDLGRAVSDTAARLRALTTLQGRLEALLANRTGKVADLLEIERELARVGGEIDAVRSALADMRGRVTLPRATIVYRPDSLAVAGAEASDGSLAGRLYRVATESAFLMLNVVAAVLPWLLLLGVPAWLLWRALRRRRAP